jgi:hypothetical protein
MKRSLAAVAAAAALALTGCGSGTDTATSTTASQTSTTTTASPTETATSGESVDFAAVAAESAAAVKAKKSAHMTMSMGSEGTIDADVDYASTPQSMKMSMKLSDQTMELVYVDRIMYMGGDMFAQLSNGKKWIKIDPKGTDPMSKQMGPMLSQIETSMANPVEALAALKDVKATVKSSDSSSTTYTVTLTKAQLTEMAKKQGAPGVSSGDLGSLPAEITYDYTIGAYKLPQKMSMTLGGQAMDMVFSKWGESVSISAPPASEVGTFAMPTS